jgi:hypothetical protein
MDWECKCYSLPAGKSYPRAGARKLVTICAMECLAVEIDLLEKRCNLFSLSAKDDAILLNLLYRKQPASVERICLFRP